MDSPFETLKILCNPTEEVPKEAFSACKMGKGSCFYCVLETILLHRLSLIEDNADISNIEIPELLNTTRVKFASVVLDALMKISKQLPRGQSLSLEQKTLVSLAFDSLLNIEFFPLLPESSPRFLDHRRSKSKELYKWKNHPRPSDDDCLVILLTHLHLFLSDIASSDLILEELIDSRNFDFFHNFIDICVFICGSSVLNFDTVKYPILKELEDIVKDRLPLEVCMRILLSNLNRCSQLNSNGDSLFATQYYSKLLSLIFTTKENAVKVFLQTFMETSSEEPFDKLSFEDIWKRACVISGVLIMCPSFCKPSNYYPKLAQEMISLVDVSGFKSIDRNFPLSVLSALLLQPELVDQRKPKLVFQLSKIIRKYFFPVLLQPFLQSDMHIRITVKPQNDTVVDLVCFARVAAALKMIPKTCWNSIDSSSDIIRLLTGLLPFSLEIILDKADVEYCKSISAIFLRSFPPIPTSKSTEAFVDWIFRYSFEHPMNFGALQILPADASEFQINCTDAGVEGLDFNARVSLVKEILNQSLCRKSYVLAVWSIFLSTMQRLLLFIQENVELHVSAIYLVLGNLAEEIATFTDDEYSEVFISNDRFEYIIDFVSSLCERISVEAEDIDSKLFETLEQSLSMIMTLVSSVTVEKAGDEQIMALLQRLTPKLNKILNNPSLSKGTTELLKTFLEMIGVEDVNVTTHFTERSLISNKEIEKAMADIENPLIPIKGHGLIQCRRLIENGPTSDHREDLTTLLDAFLKCIGHEDSYVYLNAVSAMASLGIRFHSEVVAKLATYFSGQCQTKLDCDTRLRIGECLCRILKQLGDLAPKYRSLLIDSCLITSKSSNLEENSDDAVKMRCSALSTLGQLVEVLGLSLSRDQHEVLLCLSSYLNSPNENIEVKRASCCALVLLLRGFTNRQLAFELADVLRDTGRVLRSVHCLDEILQVHIDMGLEEIDRIGKMLLDHSSTSQPSFQLPTKPKITIIQ